MIATYHNHTTWSDGRAGVAELVEAAAAQGVDELGISDHLVLHPDGRRPSWAMATDALPDYVAEVLAAAASSKSPAVRLGVEVDWFPGQARVIREALAGHPWDFLIGSVHEVAGFPIDTSPEPWRSLDPRARNEMHRAYWEQVRLLADSGLFDIIAHVDLSKKFGFPATVDLAEEIDAALDAIAASGAVVELNTAGWHKICRDAYPSTEILQACHARHINVTISADAHRPGDLLRDFARAADRLRRSGYREVARFRNRTITFDPLEAAVAGLPSAHAPAAPDDF